MCMMIGQRDRLYKVARMSWDPWGISNWHSVVLIEDPYGFIRVFHITKQNDSVRYSESHLRGRKEADELLKEILERAERLDVPYEVLDFSQVEDLRSQLEMIDNPEVVLGMTREELEIVVSWKRI